MLLFCSTKRIQGAGGACTNALISVVTKSQDVTWVELLKQMRQVLGTKGFEQIPQLSCSRKMDMATTFTPINAQPSGRKKSLFIGINYVGQRGELRGCHNDVDSMQRLMSKYGFSVVDGQDCAVFMDDGQHNSPTHANIVNAFRWLVQDAQAGDSLFMHYSGHGGYVRDESGDEKDGRDETIIPVDFQSNGQITDDEIYQALVVPLPAGVTFTVVMDCCHSGSVFDLPYCIQADDATIQAISSGAVPEMHQNPAFSFSKLFAIGKKLAMLHMSGAKPSYIASQALKEVSLLLSSTNHNVLFNSIGRRNEWRNGAGTTSHVCCLRFRFLLNPSKECRKWTEWSKWANRKSFTRNGSIH